MDVERKDDGRWHFSLGVVEKWVVGAGVAALFALMTWFTNSVDNRAGSMETRMGTQEQAMHRLATQQEVTNAQLLTLTAQLADVPSLSRQLAEVKVQVSRNQEDIRELRGTRGLR